MPELPWLGHWIALDADGAVTWRRCAVCNRALTDPVSQERGVGPICVDQEDDDVIAAANEEALEHDRELWRVEDRADPARLPGWRVNEPTYKRRMTIARHARLASLAGAPNLSVRQKHDVRGALMKLAQEDPAAYERYLAFKHQLRRARAAS